MRSGPAWIAMLSLFGAPLNGRPTEEPGPVESGGVEPGSQVRPNGIAAPGVTRPDRSSDDARAKGSPATGPTRAWSVSLDLTFADKDYGRPLRVLGPTYQQNINIQYRIRVLGTIGLNSWTDQGLTKTNGVRYSEWDTSVYWRHDVYQAGSLELGYLRFDYPGQVSSPWTHEVYAILRGKFFLTPYFAAYRDVGAYRGWYLKGGASHRFTLDGLLDAIVRGVSFELGGNLSWGDDRTIRRYFLQTDNRSSASLIGGSQTATLQVPLYRSVSFSGALSPYCTLLERIASTSHPRTSWVFGLTLNLSL